MPLVLLKWYLKNISHCIVITLLWVMPPIINLLLYFALLHMFLTWPVTQYPINIASILGIWATDCLAPPMDAEVMVGHRRTMEVDDSRNLSAFPKQNLIRMLYMLSVCWLHLLEILGHYVIHPG